MASTKLRYYIVRIHDPAPDSDYRWYIVERDTGRTIAMYGSRAMVRERCKMYNSAEYQEA